MVEIEVGGRQEGVCWMCKVIAIEYVEAVKFGNTLPNCRKTCQSVPLVVHHLLMNMGVDKGE